MNPTAAVSRIIENVFFDKNWNQILNISARDSVVFFLPERVNPPRRVETWIRHYGLWLATRNTYLGCVLIAAFGLPATANDRVNFNRDIRPILSDKCFACHGLDQNARKADLRLDQRDIAIQRKAIVPGLPAKSSLVERIVSTDSEVVMPPPRSNKSLTEEQKLLLQTWIEEGAEYHPHWSLIPIPKVTRIPELKERTDWIRSPIDAFILAECIKFGLIPSQETTREKWLRRASFDLTGLPPSLEELDTFIADSSPNAYETAADKLLNSQAFGERMANEWLDVARFADTFGYQSDRNMNVWPWRDWLIRAFNDNLSYDQFIIWQTAGDLLPNATPDQRLATAFNRLHRQTNEGGSIEEEFRQAYIADRVVTNGTAFLGITLECARCHDHKYDPITQADFYRLAAFFSTIDEHGLYSHFTETAPTPAMPLYEGNLRERHLSLLATIQAKKTQLEQIRQEAHQRFLNHLLATVKIGTENELEKVLTDTASPVLIPKLHLTFDEAKVSGENKLVPGVSGKAIAFAGDDGFNCAGSGQYGRVSPFTVTLWLKPGESKPRTVVLHQSVAAEDAAFRGYSLVLDDGKIQFSLVHFWPGNAIQIQSIQKIPLNEWTHVGITYDGSSTASGAAIFVNGRRIETTTLHDNLTRDIRYRKEWGDSNSGGVELSLGARFRDIGFHEGAIDELFVYDDDLSAIEILKLYREQASTTATASSREIAVSVDDRFELYRRRMDADFRAALQELRSLQNDENELITLVPQIMVMQESPEPRPTHILKRGAYDAPGDTVTADVPQSLFPFPPDLPKNRLGFAKWLVDDRNPLTSRVAANRFWSLFFGRGIVPSVEDFGGQGQLPSHPELLDWLARNFIDSGWNVKRFCKQIVLSATYRQSSIPLDPSAYKVDPDNRFLARGPQYRLSAEQLRDNALAVSGLLVPKIGGPSVLPYQPAGLWEESGTGQSYHQSKGDGLYRRSLYTFWRRTSPPPNMLSFDATGREVCTARRERTATPMQALVLLNDPQYLEASRVLAEKTLKQPAENRVARLQSIFRQLTSRNPSKKELEVLVRLFEDQKRFFDGAVDEAKRLLSTGESRRDESLDLAEHAAMTIVASAVMNFDECVTKR